MPQLPLPSVAAAAAVVAVAVWTYKSSEILLVGYTTYRPWLVEKAGTRVLNSQCNELFVKAKDGLSKPFVFVVLFVLLACGFCSRA